MLPTHPDPLHGVTLEPIAAVARPHLGLLALRVGTKRLQIEGHHYEPQLGQVSVVLDFGGSMELLHMASSVTEAELWIAREGYRNARLQIVGNELDRAGVADIAA